MSLDPKGDVRRPTRRQGFVGLALLAVVLASCTPDAGVSPESSERCQVTPTTSRSINGHTLWGKGDRQVFLYMFPGGREAKLDTRPHKFLVFLESVPESPPSSIHIEALNLTSQSRTRFEALRHGSEFGVEWGTSFKFPNAGCWRLDVNESGNVGTIVIEIHEAADSK